MDGVVARASATVVMEHWRDCAAALAACAWRVTCTLRVCFEIGCADTGVVAVRVEVAEKADRHGVVFRYSRCIGCGGSNGDGSGNDVGRGCVFGIGGDRPMAVLLQIPSVPKTLFSGLA